MTEKWPDLPYVLPISSPNPTLLAAKKKKKIYYVPTNVF